MNLPILALKRPVAVIVLLIATVVLGLFGLSQLPVNLLPDVTYPLVKVYITWRGATPQEIEDNIATVVERKLSTVDGLDYLDSQCTEGMYSLLVNFDYSVDRDVAYQDVLAKLGTVKKNLPKDADEPFVMKADPSQLPVVDIAISSTQMDTTKLRAWVEHYLQDEFSTVPGTAGSDVSGGKIREIRVDLDQKRLQYYRLSADDVSQKLRDANVEMMGGRITGDRREFVVRTVGEFSAVDEIGNVIVSSDKAGGTVRVKDIAQVHDSADVQRVITKLNGNECVRLSVFKQAGANTVAVAHGIQEKIRDLEGRVPEGVQMSVTYNQADYIESSVAGVRDSALIAALLVMLVVAFFLKGWRRVAIVAITIPVTVFFTLFVMRMAGFSVNIFSLAALVIAISLILDDCVVVIENITRIRADASDQVGLTGIGATQVAGAVLSSTVTFLALFVPFLLVPGIVSLLFRELIITVAIAVAISTVVALTATPALYRALYPEHRADIERDTELGNISNRFLNWCLGIYRQGVNWSLERRRLVIVLVIASFIAGLFLVRHLGSEFIPEMDDGQIIVKVKNPSGTSVAETARVLKGIEDVVRGLKGIDRYYTLAGGRVWGLVTYENANEGEVDIQLVPKAKRKMSTKQYVAWLSPVVAKQARVPGAKIKVMHAKVKGIRLVGDYDIEIEIYAPRSEPMENIYDYATDVMKQVKDTPGLANPDLSIDISKPEYQVFVDRNRAEDLGLSVSKVASTVRAVVNGNVGTQFKDGGYYYNIRTVAPGSDLRDKASLENLAIASPRGGVSYLRDVATVVSSVGPVEIDRKDQVRMIKVTGSAQGRSIGEVTSAIRQRLAKTPMPPGYFIKYGGQSQMMAESFASMGLILLLSMFLAYVILAIQFESFIEPFLIVIRVPLSLIGLSLALYLTGTPIGVTVMIGIVALAGIEVYHGVVLLTLVNQLREQGLAPTKAIVQAGALRLRPILMTLIVGIAGLLPLALGIGEGTETLQPMAIGVIGGLIFSLPLTLFFLPALYLSIFGERSLNAGRRPHTKIRTKAGTSNTP